MALSVVQNLFKERKYPFILASTILLLLFVTLLILTAGSQSSLSFYSGSDLQRRISSPTPTPTPPPSNSSVPAPVGEPPRKAPPLGLSLKWAVCKGPTAVDFIPCLDNFKAIKGLKSRRHMEHRERHCPSPSPRCLVPLPKGYKVPVPWPKSRDMVRLIY